MGRILELFEAKSALNSDDEPKRDLQPCVKCSIAREAIPHWTIGRHSGKHVLVRCHIPYQTSCYDSFEDMRIEWEDENARYVKMKQAVEKKPV